MKGTWPCDLDDLRFEDLYNHRIISSNTEVGLYPMAKAHYLKRDLLLNLDWKRRDDKRRCGGDLKTYTTTDIVYI